MYVFACLYCGIGATCDVVLYRYKTGPSPTHFDFTVEILHPCFCPYYYSYGGLALMHHCLPPLDVADIDYYATKLSRIECTICTMCFAELSMGDDITKLLPPTKQQCAATPSSRTASGTGAAASPSSQQQLDSNQPSTELPAGDLNPSEASKKLSDSPDHHSTTTTTSDTPSQHNHPNPGLAPSTSLNLGSICNETTAPIVVESSSTEGGATSAQQQAEPHQQVDPLNAPSS